jgi:TatD DNase family protein
MNPVTPIRLFDTHCHVDLYPDPAKLVAECDQAGIYTIAVTNAPAVFSATRELVAQSRYVRAAIGLHPELVMSHANDLDKFWSALDHTRYVGEIGLDYVTQDQAVRARQRGVLAQILERCANYGDKVLTLHSRRAAGDVIGAIGPAYPGRVILHWYAGTQRDLKRAVDFGFYFSINPQMASAESSTRLIQKMPPDRVLLETDGPFVAVENGPAWPGDTRRVVERLASIWEKSESDTAERLFVNFETLLQSPLARSFS